MKMKEGKTYCLNPGYRDSFIEENENNEQMVEIIEQGGGTFTVLEMGSFNEGSYVNRIRTKNGDVYTADSHGDDYFELSSDEFCYFDEVKVEPEVTSRGVVSLELVVDSANAEEMVELIKKVFNK